MRKIQHSIVLLLFCIFSSNAQENDFQIWTSLSASDKVTYKTDINVFFDTANVWSVDYNSAIDDTNKIRSSVGLAANVFTQIGPLSFVLAQDLTKSTNDETETFNFRLGTSF